MKRFKKVMILSGIAVLLLGVAVFLALRPVPAPAAPALLREAPPEADDLREALEVEGVGGSRFFIQYPREEALQTVSVSRFGASPDNEDNADALNAAFAFCAENPGTCLLFEPVTYYVSGQLKLNDLKDVLSAVQKMASPAQVVKEVKPPEQVLPDKPQLVRSSEKRKIENE